MLEFLAAVSNTGTNLDVCSSDSNLLWIVQVLRIVIRIISIAAPFALIIFGSLDFFKAIIAGDEKEMKAKRKPFIGRLIAAILILLMPTIINIVMKAISKTANSSFAKCWDAASDAGWNVVIPTNNNPDKWDDN